MIFCIGKASSCFLSLVLNVYIWGLVQYNSQLLNEGIKEFGILSIYKNKVRVVRDHIHNTVVVRKVTEGWDGNHKGNNRWKGESGKDITMYDHQRVPGEVPKVRVSGKVPRGTF